MMEQGPQEKQRDSGDENDDGNSFDGPAELRFEDESSKPKGPLCKEGAAGSEEGGDEPLPGGTDNTSSEGGFGGGMVSTVERAAIHSGNKDFEGRGEIGGRSSTVVNSPRAMISDVSSTATTAEPTQNEAGYVSSATTMAATTVPARRRCNRRLRGRGSKWKRQKGLRAKKNSRSKQKTQDRRKGSSIHCASQCISHWGAMWDLMAAGISDRQEQRRSTETMAALSVALPIARVAKQRHATAEGGQLWVAATSY